jgi:diguanylate cyclase (GGDEF)-like protein
MRNIELSQILETLSLGVFVLDPEGRIAYWNRWLESASDLPRAEAVGRSVFELFPELGTSVFRRNLKSVLAFGNFAYFSQKVHGRLLNLRPLPGSPAGFELMEQNCAMGPIREDGKVAYAYVTVQDVSELVSHERILAELATKDVLTSAFNRRFFDRRLAEELERCERYGRSLGLVMLDIDFFKAVNDRYGHQFGDQALRMAVELWKKALRTSDLVARYGGEEFCILLPEAGLEESLALAERLRASVAEAEVRCLEQTARITVSAGVAVSRASDCADGILRRADEALYRAKAGGRNRVEASEP